MNFLIIPKHAVSLEAKPRELKCVVFLCISGVWESSQRKRDQQTKHLTI